MTQVKGKIKILTGEKSMELTGLFDTRSTLTYISEVAPEKIGFNPYHLDCSLLL